MLLTLKRSKFWCTLTIGQWTLGPITPSLPPPPDRPSNMESLPLIVKILLFNSIGPFFRPAVAPVKANQLLVIDVYTEWSGPCTAVESHLRRLRHSFVEAPDTLALARACCDRITDLQAFKQLRSLPSLAMGLSCSTGSLFWCCFSIDTLWYVLNVLL